MEYINANKLIKIKITNKDSLPLQSHWGTLYMIRNKSIIEFYSYYANDDLDLARSRPYVEPYYKCIVHVKHLDMSDVSDIHEFFTDDEMLSTNVDKTINFMMALVKSGFECYIKN